MKTQTLFTLMFFTLLCCSFSASGEKLTAYKQDANSIKNSIHETNKLLLASGSFDPKFESLDFSSKGIVSKDSDNYGIIQFYNKKADFNWLTNRNFKVIQSMTHNAYVVNWQGAHQTDLTNNDDIRWFGAYEAGYKVSPKLWQENRANTVYQLISVHSFKGVSYDLLTGLINKYLPNQEIAQTNIPKGFGQLVLKVKSEDVETVLNTLVVLEDVQWLAAYKQQEFFNAEAVSATQSGMSSGGSGDSYVPINTPIFDKGLFGSGQIVGVADSGLDRNEDWFVNLDKGNGVVTAITDAEAITFPTLGTLHPENKVIAYWTMPGAVDYDIGAFHGTHVSGSVAGDRSQAIGVGPAAFISSPTSSGYDNDDGMAPNAQILFNDIGALIGSNGRVSLSGEGSTPMWRLAFAGGAAIHTNSYGSGTGGEYTGSDNRADLTLRELDDMMIIFAAGNDGSGANTTGSPANAKNVVAVGALFHGNSTTLASFSSRGPTDDGRLKPDVSVTGNTIDSARGDTNNSSTIDAPSRSTKNGTSMAAPIVAGSSALLRQYFTDGFYPTGIANNDDAHTPSGTLMKAMLLNGTNTDGGFFTNNIGWGRVWLENTLYFDGDARRFRFWEKTNDSGLQTGEQFSIELEVQAGQEFRATLVWYDVPGPTGSGVTLVNNLDLTVSTAGNDYLGNNFTSGNSVTTGSADLVNTVEQVRFTAPIAGTYTITVDAANIVGDGSFGSDKQGFSLAVSGDLSSGNVVPANPPNPISLTAVSNGLVGVDLNWSDVSTDYEWYEIYRVEGSCASADLTAMRYVGEANTNAFVDNSTVGGYQYSYKVRAFSDDLVSQYTNCIDVVSEQVCSIPPEFINQTSTITSNTGSNCQIGLQWQPASSNCPSATDVRYNIYRSTTHGFVPSASNKIATTNLNAVSYLDVDNLVTNQTYFYIVKAEDNTSSGTGPNSGNETIATHEIATTPIGVATSDGVLVDDVDNGSFMNIESVWSISNEQFSNGSLSYRSAKEGDNTHPANICGRMTSPELEISIPITTPGNSPSISYQARYDLEDNWDGVVVEISTDGGTTWVDLPPDGGYPSDFSSTGTPPINICGYAASHGAFNGSTGGGFVEITHDLAAFIGQAIKIRWSISSDPGTEEEGFYLDELQYNSVLAPQACMSQIDLIYANGFE